jgi:protein-arginine kinase activator protein McsA
MTLERTASGHHFDMASRACVRCGMTHKEFLEKGRPACSLASDPDPVTNRNIRREQGKNDCVSQSCRDC